MLLRPEHHENMRQRQFIVDSSDEKKCKPLSLQIIRELDQNLAPRLSLYAKGRDNMEGFRFVMRKIARWIEIIEVKTGKQKDVCYCFAEFKRNENFAADWRKA